MSERAKYWKEYIVGEPFLHMSLDKNLIDDYSEFLKKNCINEDDDPKVIKYHD